MQENSKFHNESECKFDVEFESDYLEILKISLDSKILKSLHFDIFGVKIDRNGGCAQGKSITPRKIDNTIEFFVKNHAQKCPPIFEILIFQKSKSWKTIPRAHFLLNPRFSLKASPEDSASHHTPRYANTPPHHNTRKQHETGIANIHIYINMCV